MTDHDDEIARSVARNLDTLDQAVGELEAVPELTTAHVDALHRRLLPGEGKGGGNTDLEDLVAYVNTADHGALVQAALVHARFMTIGPYADANGRVGRALIQTVLTRRGLSTSAILPVSVALLARHDEYAEGLAAYRNGDPAHWLRLFLRTARAAAERVGTFADELAAVRDVWDGRCRAAGLPPGPRMGRATYRLLHWFPAVPVMTASTAERTFRMTNQEARRALAQLADAGVVRPEQTGRDTFAYVAEDVLGLLTA
ncbi:Fic family protein [Herbidospora galbida]|uniref:Fic family protein n=1 Tax=Herbidospora galbida TaxID=2575442 RepID=UPI0014857298|nr:Fic family protein [Herbidospora galbida]